MNRILIRNAVHQQVFLDLLSPVIAIFDFEWILG